MFTRAAALPRVVVVAMKRAGRWRRAMGDMLG
jgi:hypothetical protein